MGGNIDFGLSSAAIDRQRIYDKYAWYTEK